MPHSGQILSRLSALGVSPSDIEERFIRGSGPGGQKINKTSSTVWLRHGPTGVEVRCQVGRSQAANRMEAWLDLCGRLEALARLQALSLRDAAERERRRARQKGRGLKAAMVDSKRRRARLKGRRGRVESD